MNCVLQSETEAGAPAEESEKPKIRKTEKKSFLYHAVGYAGAGVVLLGIAIVASVAVAIAWFLCGAAMAF